MPKTLEIVDVLEMFDKDQLELNALVMVELIELSDSEIRIHISSQ